MRYRLGIAMTAAMALAPSLGWTGELDVYSNTQLNIGQQWRAGQSTDVDPLYQFLRVSGRGVQLPGGGELKLVLDVWGAGNFASSDWWNGAVNTDHFSGDVNLAYVEGSWYGGDLRASLGRLSVGYGNSRMLQLDGFSFSARLARMFTLEAYVGAPTTQRFSGYGSIYSSNPTIGDLAAGGRLGFAYRQWVNAGVSANYAWSSGVTTRSDLAFDLKLAPVSWAYLLGYLDYSLNAQNYFDTFGSQVAEGTASLVLPVTSHLQFTVDYSYTIPSLFLPYNSILWVFSDSTSEYVGATARVGLEQFKVAIPVELELGYRHILETDTGTVSSVDGDRYLAGVRWKPSAKSAVGVEVARLFMNQGTVSNPGENSGYWNARAYGTVKVKRFTGTLDFQGYWFEQDVNGHGDSIIGNATLGYDLPVPGLSVVGGLSGGETAYFKDYVSGLVKLVYNQTYRSHEVF
jgi:hypothetical protein